MTQAKRILAIGDVHLPFMDRGKFRRLIDLIPELKPDAIVQMGDLYDMFSQGRWASTRDLMTPKQEITDGRVMAEDMWRLLQRAAPNAECYQIKGNHDDRPKKRLLEKAPEILALIDMDHLWKFENVKTLADSREELFIDGVCFIHGYRSKLGDHARYNQCRTVCGHSHTGGVTYLKIRGKGDGETAVIWELNAGYLGDETEIPFKYTMQKFNKWTHGFGWIDELGPRFCPL